MANTNLKLQDKAAGDKPIRMVDLRDNTYAPAGAQATEESSTLLAGTGTTAAIDTGYTKANWTLQLNRNSGTITSIAASLELSCDGNVWFASGAALSAVTDGGAAHATGKPARYYRLNVTTLGGQSGNFPRLLVNAC